MSTTSKQMLRCPPHDNVQRKARWVSNHKKTYQKCTKRCTQSEQKSQQTNKSNSHRAAQRQRRKWKLYKWLLYFIIISFKTFNRCTFSCGNSFSKQPICCWLVVYRCFVSKFVVLRCFFCVSSPRFVLLFRCVCVIRDANDAFNVAALSVRNKFMMFAMKWRSEPMIALAATLTTYAYAFVHFLRHFSLFNVFY